MSLARRSQTEMANDRSPQRFPAPVNSLPRPEDVNWFKNSEMTLSEWERLLGQHSIGSLTLSEMRQLFDECPEPQHSEIARELWRMIVAMVHTRRQPADLPSEWTWRTFDQGLTKEPVH